MSIREKRLKSDNELMRRTFSASRQVTLIGCSDSTLEKYEIEIHIGGLQKKGDDVETVYSHRVEIVLPANYPAEAPHCRMLTPVFHPNITEGMIFISDYWMSVGSLTALVVRIGAMIAYQQYDINTPLNVKAAKWAAKNRYRFPIDLTVISPDPVQIDSSINEPSGFPEHLKESSEAKGKEIKGETEGRRAPETGSSYPSSDRKTDLTKDASSENKCEQQINCTRLTLEICSGPDRGKWFTFRGPCTILLGRGGPGYHVDITLSPDDPYVSRRHCSLQIGADILLIDLKSVNPPVVNGAVMEKGILKNGDVLQIGFTEFNVTVEYGGPVESAAAGFDAGSKVVFCNGCGARLDMVPGADAPDHCPFCPEKKTVNNKSDQLQPSSYRCKCGTDCSLQAQSDGRDKELKDVVQYQCPICIEREIEEESLNIGPYQVLNTLGRGGMGVVYRVYHRATARILAIKQVLGLYADPEIIHRFEREVRYLGDLRHPNILRFIDNGSTEEGPYLAMEFARRGNLEALLVENNGKIAPSQAVRIVIQCLDGLIYMHGKGIIHRDIKPENIVLQENDSGEIIPKLADFGLAKNQYNAASSQLTRLGAKIGSLFYMPPEQFIDAATVREPADTYAMGVTLYYLLTGRYPYEFPAPQHLRDIMNKHHLSSAEEAVSYLTGQGSLKLPDVLIQNEAPVPVMVHDTSIPEEIAVIVDKAVRKKSEERFTTAEEFKAELGKIIEKVNLK